MNDATRAYYAQKELVYAAQKNCANLYSEYTIAKENWERACQKLYAIERKANELAEEMFK